MADFPAVLTSAVDNTTDVLAKHLNNLEAKVGINDSAVMTSLDFIAKNSYEGHLINGKIVPSVANNDLTVAIKGKDGNDASATNPIYVVLGGIVRKITAALSITLADGTNYFNAGSSEHATKEIDYFVYLGYNSTDGVVVGFARVPYGQNYDDFSVTNTSEEYCAISTITNASSNDYYHVIGRFAATLSAGAGYTWTVPGYTANNLVQYPIYETRWLAWVPTVAWTGGAAPTSLSYSVFSYRVRMKEVTSILGMIYSTAGTTITSVSWTPPFSVVSTSYMVIPGAMSNAFAPIPTYMQLGQNENYIVRCSSATVDRAGSQLTHEI